MTARVAFRQDDVRRAAKGAVDAGLSVARIEVENGRIIVIVGDPDKSRINPLDRLYG
jgi:hypothetical protein